MNYYKDSNGNIYGYDDEQVAMGLAEGKTQLTQQELDELLNPPAPPPVDPQDLPANPTVYEWNKLCEAAGVPTLKKL